MGEDCEYKVIMDIRPLLETEEETYKREYVAKLREEYWVFAEADIAGMFYSLQSFLDWAHNKYIIDEKILPKNFD